MVGFQLFDSVAKTMTKYCSIKINQRGEDILDIIFRLLSKYSGHSRKNDL